jgi:hypothetical protein
MDTQTRLTTTLASTAMILLESICPAESLDRAPGAALLVTPATGMAFSGTRGGPFSPASFEYRVSASSGTVSYSIRTPSWLTASSSFGTADTSGVTITVTVNSTALRLAPGDYGPGVVFTNATNGRGTTTRNARLIVRGPSHSPPSTGKDGTRRYLLEPGPGHLLDDRGGKLLAE